MYDPKSLKAEEFIDHREVLDTLAYAEKTAADHQAVVEIMAHAADLLISFMSCPCLKLYELLPV